MLNRHNIDSTNSHKECFMPKKSRKSQVYIWCTQVYRRSQEACSTVQNQNIFRLFKQFSLCQKTLFFFAPKISCLLSRFALFRAGTSVHDKMLWHWGKSGGNESRGDRLLVAFPTKFAF